ncbi:hypothetical protein GcC1_188044 [Golovinomyces cichoracearum]|uniref:Post-SET domain-containing protein n=1 Tax=Golovinomyces cichoracearum TaxID=62708 RepID=A0A420HJB8_9PEZI|nr:hypothetical protein GcC1_188044 [Golovinomyces cichoracearum]
MAPVIPHWKQPSHPEIQEVIHSSQGSDSYSTKSISRINLAPFSRFASFEFPPSTITSQPTYATVQLDAKSHMNLNSDLLYINHSCEPSLIFDVTAREVRTGPEGLKVGQELTFFYPSTEWTMVQSFDCTCGTPSCLGRISGARDIGSTRLSGYWLNSHIRELLEAEQQKQKQQFTDKN